MKNVRDMSKNKDQHYVSAFYLYNFTNEEQRTKSKEKKRKTCIHHFDFKKGSLNERPIESIATESYLFSFKRSDNKYDHSLDDELKVIENRSVSVFSELNDILSYVVKSKTGSIEISDSLINNLLEFIGWQLRRNPEIVNELDSECKTYLENSKGDTSKSKEMALKVVRDIGEYGEFNLLEELHKRDKRIVFTTNPSAHFITTDNPLVRFNKHGRDGFGMAETEIYFPLSSNMLLFMSGEGDTKEFRVENDRVFLRKVNSYLCRKAIRYVFGRSGVYLNRIARNHS